MLQTANIELPGLDCGLCGYRTCEELRERLAAKPEMIRRCIHLAAERAQPEANLPTLSASAPTCPDSCASACGTACTAPARIPSRPHELDWCDRLGREFDFYLEHFPEEPGPARSSSRTTR